jgi:hypothetical protein
MLVAKVGSGPDMVIYGRSDGRFQLGRDLVAFELDNSGKASGLVIEQGERKIPASRIR